jgi:NAD(P)-dependent dehydrogenase (short-subunit alcohol dehydrogenase family)
MRTDFKGKVAIVTGAANGLGKAYALALAKAGARLVVNDLGGDSKGVGRSNLAAKAVADDITAMGGEALASDCSVTDEAGIRAMVDRVTDRWGRVDILINNAGILQPRHFARVDMADFRQVVDVNLMGAAICSHAVWNIMREQGYGRILMTTSEGALYPVPGAAGYAAAKLGLVGLMNALSVEGREHGIRVNSIAPAAATRMTKDMLNAGDFLRMGPESVVATALYLVSDAAPTGATLAVGAGRIERAFVTHSRGVELDASQLTPAEVAAHFAAISDRAGDSAPDGLHSVARVEQVARQR